MFSSWWSLSLFSRGTFWVAWGGKKSSLLSSGGGNTDMTGLHIESKWSSKLKNYTCCAVWPSQKKFYHPPKKKVMKIATSKFLVIPMTLDRWLWTQNVSMKAVCLASLGGHSSRLAVNNSSFQHRCSTLLHMIVCDSHRDMESSRKKHPPGLSITG